MILALLGLLDIIAGFCLLFSKSIPQSILFYLGIIILIKAIFSIAGSFLTKYFLDFMGFIDLVTAILLIFSWNIPWFWILPVSKGAYSLIFGIIR